MDIRNLGQRKNRIRRRRRPLVLPFFQSRRRFHSRSCSPSRRCRFGRFRRGAAGKPLLLLLLLLLALLLAAGLFFRGEGLDGGPEGGPLELQTSFAGDLNLPAHVGSGSEFPADFSADLSLNPSSGLLPASRGGSGSAAPVAAMALSRLGDPCFQPQAVPGKYLDCSALVQWCYERLGIAVPRTAADQAKYCLDNFLEVPRSQLQCGDLIFWSFKENGRYKNISHTGIYAGGGKIIDASYSRSQVVYRDLYDPDKIVMCGRIPVR